VALPPSIVRLTLLLAVSACGCGFRPVDASRVFGPGVRRIEIRAFDNESPEPGVERMLADSLVEEFARRGVLTPLYGSTDVKGDLVLQGVLSRVKEIPSAFSSVSLVLEDRLEIELDVSIVRRSTQEEVWKRRGWTLSERFLSSPDPQVYQSNKEQALRRLSSVIAGRIHDELFQQF
jgi:hypothetical protein